MPGPPAADSKAHGFPLNGLLLLIMLAPVGVLFATLWLRPPRPDVLLITLHGARVEHEPAALRTLLQRGVRFRQAFSQSDHITAAHFSLLTSQWPHRLPLHPEPSPVPAASPP